MLDLTKYEVFLSEFASEGAIAAFKEFISILEEDFHVLVGDYIKGLSQRSLIALSYYNDIVYVDKWGSVRIGDYYWSYVDSIGVDIRCLPALIAKYKSTTTIGKLS